MTKGLEAYFDGGAEFDIAQRAFFGLSCLAVHQALPSMLVLDAPYGIASVLSHALAELVEEAEAQKPKLVYVPSDATEDQLWGQLSLARLTDCAKPSIESTSLFFDPRNPWLTRVLVVSDLAHLGLAARRGLTILLDAPVVHLERHGLRRAWVPRVKCIAFCQRRDLANISVHLLDRFAIRIDVGRMRDSEEERVRSLLETVSRASHSAGDAPSSRERGLASRVAAGRLMRPVMTDEALERVEAFTSLTGGQGHRRGIALARLSTAVAMLRQDAEARAEDVLMAASVQGLYLNRPAAPPREQAQPKAAEPKKERSVEPDIADALPQSLMHEGPQPSGLTPAAGGLSQAQECNASATEESRFASSLPFQPADTPYAEDRTSRERMVGALLPLRQAAKFGDARHGPILGSARTNIAKDLAWLDTIRTAAVYQRLRGRKTRDKLIIRRSDLRQNLRAVTPSNLMIIVVDQSDSVGIDWEQTLVKELETAYTERAPVTVITAGEDSKLPTRAATRTVSSRQFTAIRAALRRPKGHASPLAHALLIALRQIDKASNHGRNAVHKIRLVVATDGRANVPLSLSRDGVLQPGLGLRAFEDAVEIAQQISCRAKVSSLLLDPGSQYHSELPLRLAAALGAEYRLVG
jgi:magnesium chelatase subunit D